MVLTRARVLRFLLLLVLVAAAVVFVTANWRRVNPLAPAGAALVTAAARGAGTLPVAASAGSATASAASAGSARASAASAGGSSASAADYFAAAHLQRAQAESREIAGLQQLAGEPGTAAAVRAEAQEQVLQLEQLQEEEAAAELVLQAKGYPQALVLLHPGGATVVVQAATFGAGPAALVAQAVAAAAGLDAADVQVIARGATA